LVMGTEGSPGRAVQHLRLPIQEGLVPEKTA
jgi:hypothetical protein